MRENIKNREMIIMASSILQLKKNYKHMKKKLLYLIVIMLLGIQLIVAQEFTKIDITFGTQDEVLKRAIEKNVGNLLFACNKAERSGGKPSFNNETNGCS